MTAGACGSLSTVIPANRKEPRATFDRRGLRTGRLQPKVAGPLRLIYEHRSHREAFATAFRTDALRTIRAAVIGQRGQPAKHGSCCGLAVEPIPGHPRSVRGGPRGHRGHSVDLRTGGPTTAPAPTSSGTRWEWGPRYRLLSGTLGHQRLAHHDARPPYSSPRGSDLQQHFVTLGVLPTLTIDRTSPGERILFIGSPGLNGPQSQLARLGIAGEFLAVLPSRSGTQGRPSPKRSWVGCPSCCNGTPRRRILSPKSDRAGISLPGPSIQPPTWPPSIHKRDRPLPLSKGQAKFVVAGLVLVKRPR